MIARATDSRIIHKPMDLNQVVEANGPGWTGSLTPARVDPLTVISWLEVQATTRGS